MKIVTIVGARPQFIKASAVSREINRCIAEGSPISEVIVHTGQHFDAKMSRVFFDEMGIPSPQYNLGIGGTSHGAMTGRMIEKLEEVLESECPDLVLLYGDTNSTLAGSIAASKLDIDIAHVEAGMRSFNTSMPEEINRILADRVSRFLFCPTNAAKENLSNEGVEHWGDRVEVVMSGDVMLDSAMYYQGFAKKPDSVAQSDSFNLCTIHRAENTDDGERLQNIFAALNEIARDKQLVMPLHPRTRKILDEAGYDHSNITLIDPVGYLNMTWLLGHCDMVITDSGGLQKEAFFFGKSCLTLRDETEWVELVELGFNQLAGANESRILELYRNDTFNRDFDVDLYGGGKASSRIVQKLLDCYETGAGR